MSSSDTATTIGPESSVKSILLLGASFTTDNMGVSALASGAIAILRARFPQADIELLDYGARPQTFLVTADRESIEVPLINLRFSWKIFLRNNIAYLISVVGLRSLFRRFFRDTAVEDPWLKSIYRADIAVAVSGGDSFSDIYGLARFFYVYLPQLLVVLAGKKLVILPQTIGPFDRFVSRTLASWLLKRSTLVYSRDLEGVEQARKLVGAQESSPRIDFCYDMGFLLEPRKPKDRILDDMRPHCERLLVGLNVSGLLLIEGYGKDNAFELRVNYGKLIERTIDLLVNENDADVVLVPHVFGDEDESDTVACATLYAQLAEKYKGHLFCLNGKYDQHEIKYLIGQTQFFIGARMHACIAALSQTIPAVGIAYSKKFSGVFESVGVGHLIADPRHMSMEEILAVISNGLRQRAKLQGRLRDTMIEVRRELLTCMDGVF